jgi:hypothetical protein
MMDMNMKKKKGNLQAEINSFWNLYIILLDFTKYVLSVNNTVTLLYEIAVYPEMWQH